MGLERDHHSDPELGAIVNRYVMPGRRYSQLMGGYNLRDLDDAERAQFGRAMAEDARRITDEELEELFDYEWRAALTAGWLVGLTRRERHRDRIGELLLDSDRVWEGDGFCFALARFGTPQDAQLLVEYLSRNLPQLDRNHDQEWAMGALHHVDKRLGTNYADQFLDGAWQRWAEVRIPDHFGPDEHREHVELMCAYADDWMR